MRVLVCGGRDYTDFWTVHYTLTRLVNENSIIIQGGAKGADALAVEWAKDMGFPYATVPAHWDKYGKKAGVLRNAWMLMLQPDIVIAFPGGKGTANMIKLAEEAGIEVIKID